MEQTYKDWLLVLVIDGDDPHLESVALSIIPSRQLRVLHYQERHDGIAPLLNAGLKVSSAEFVARLDSDDLMVPDRLDRQINFMDSNPDHLLVGARAALIDLDGNSLNETVGGAGKTLGNRLLFRNRIVHSTAFFRRTEILGAGGYSDRAIRAEDYDLWLRVAARGEVASLNDVLASYRVSPGQESTQPTPTSTVIEVARSRRELSSALGRSNAEWLALSLLWGIARNGLYQNYMGKLRNFR